MQQKTMPSMIFIFFIALFVVSLYLLGRLLWPFVAILVMAFVVTGVFSPLYNALCKKVSSPKAAVITCIGIFVLLFLPIVLFAGILAREAYGLWVIGRDAAYIDQIRSVLESSEFLERASHFFAKYDIVIGGRELTAAASDVGVQVARFLYEQAAAIASNVLKFVLNFLFMLLIIYFFLLDGKRLLSFVTDLSPLPADEDYKLALRFKEMAGSILVANGFCGLLQGVIGGSLFAMFGFSSPIVWGAIMGILAFLPIVGIGAVFLPAAVYMFIKGRIVGGVVFVVSYAVLSFVVEYVLKPKLVGDRVQMHPLLVFLAIVGGLQVFGILGVIYGPLIATLFLTLTDIYLTNYQKLVEPDKQPPSENTSP